MITESTSHFIGLSLPSDLFQILFDELSRYIEAHYIQDSVELQRLESLHITLYYLDDLISDNELSLYEQFLNSTQRDGLIHIQSMDYFHREDSPYILYLLPENTEHLYQMNDQLITTFQRNDI